MKKEKLEEAQEAMLNKAEEMMKRYRHEVRQLNDSVEDKCLIMLGLSGLQEKLRRKK